MQAEDNDDDEWRAGGVGGRTEGGGEDNSDRQPHFLTILYRYFTFKRNEK